jgi:hypothetical protein
LNSLYLLILFYFTFHIVELMHAWFDEIYLVFGFC